jgi:hypothetical protein
MDRVTGGCLCGNVRIVASGPPYRVGLCHCLDCRKHHGSLFHASAVFPQDAVTIDGETRDYAGRFFCSRCGSSIFGRSADEISALFFGLKAEQAASVGIIPTLKRKSRRPIEIASKPVYVIWRALVAYGDSRRNGEQERPWVIEVNLGSLDAPDQLMPTYESWVIRRESWLPPFPLTRRYDRDRDATGRFEE